MESCRRSTRRPGPTTGPTAARRFQRPMYSSTTSPGPALTPIFFSHASRSARRIGVPGSTQSVPLSCAMSYRTARVAMPSFQFMMLPFAQPALGRDVARHGHAVVHHPVLEEVAPRVHVRHGEPVIAHRVVVRRAAVGDVVRRAAEQPVRVHVGRGHLRHRRRQRHDDPVSDEPDGAQHLLRRNQVRGALVVLGAPPAPRLELLPPLFVLSSKGGRVGGRCRGGRLGLRARGRRLRAQLESASDAGKHQRDTKGDRFHASHSSSLTLEQFAVLSREF